MQYEVTIGIPIFKTVDYIDATMQSALSQTYSDIEFLVVDDCGNDGSIDKVEKYQREHARGLFINILHNEKNMGISYCRNLIIDEAKGKYLFFMDSDDTIEPNTIQLLINAVNLIHAQAAFASYEIIDHVNETPNQVYRNKSMMFLGEGKLAVYAFKNTKNFHVSVCNALINVDFLRQTGVRFINTQYWEDFAFIVEFLPKVNRAILLSDTTYHYHLHTGSLSQYQKRNQFTKDEIMNNVSTIDYLKNQITRLRNQPYIPYLCYNLEMTSFYIDCYIINHRIDPAISSNEMRHILHHPMNFMDVLSFRHKFLPNFVFWIISRLPSFFFMMLINLLCKIKR